MYLTFSTSPRARLHCITTLFEKSLIVCKIYRPVIKAQLFSQNCSFLKEMSCAGTLPSRTKAGICMFLNKVHFFKCCAHHKSIALFRSISAVACLATIDFFSFVVTGCRHTAIKMLQNFGPSLGKACFFFLTSLYQRRSEDLDFFFCITVADIMENAQNLA